MSIAASSIAEIATQRDGRRWIVERFIDNVGIAWFRRYLAPAVFDIVAQLALDAAQIDADIKAAEIAANVAQVTTFGSLAVIVMNYTTASANLAALRQAYQIATQLQAIMIGDFLSTLTDAQLQSIFNLTAAQVTTLRTNKLTPAANTAAAIRAAAGQ